MNREEFKKKLSQEWEAIQARWNESRFPDLMELIESYKKLDEEERKVADEIVAEWAVSEDDRSRYDANLLIQEFHITSALPALRELEKRLIGVPGPVAADELEDIRRLISELSTAEGDDETSGDAGGGGDADEQ